MSEIALGIMSFVKDVSGGVKEGAKTFARASAPEELRPVADVLFKPKVSEAPIQYVDPVKQGEDDTVKLAEVRKSLRLFAQEIGSNPVRRTAQAVQQVQHPVQAGKR